MYLYRHKNDRLLPIHRCILPVWGILLLAFASCKKNFSSDQFIDDKLVVLAELTATDSVKIPIGKTIKAGGGGTIIFEKVNDATVVLTEGKSTSWILHPNYSAQFANNPTTLFTSRQRLRYNTTYSIEIKHPTLGNSRASTRVPLLPEQIIIDTLASDTLIQGKEVMVANISWKDAADETDYYIIEAVKEIVKFRYYFYYRGVRFYIDHPAGKALYDKLNGSGQIHLYTDTVPQNQFTRLNVYTNDVNSQNASINNLAYPFRRIFFTDNSFNGTKYSTKVFIDRQFFIADDPTQRGRVRLQFKSVSKALYDYLFIYEKYKTEFGTLPVNQLAYPSGNIQNGLGIFGASARHEKIFYFDNKI